MADADRMPALVPGSPITAIAVTDATGATEVPLEASTTRFSIRNLGPNTAYLSTETGVTSGTGFPIPNGATSRFGKVPAAALSLYFVCATGQTADLRLIEEQ